MIKLNKLISEAFRHYLYGDDTAHWTVKKAYDAHVFYGGSERNNYKTIRKLRNKDCIKQKLLRHKSGIKRGKN